LTVNLKVVKLRPIARLSATSAGADPPGAPGFSDGCKFVSRSGLEVEEVVVGSVLGAPMYRRIAELIPPSKPVVPRLGLARTQ
jgi:hypothetical protein